jgi:hypothetical protein
VVFYTSGTAGHPKSAELRHRNVYDNALIGGDLFVADLGRPDTYLCVLPLFHAFGQTVIQNGAFAFGGTIVMQPRFEARAALRLMLAHDVTWLSHRPPPREGSPPGGRRRPSRRGWREDPRTSSGPRRRTLCRLIAISPISSGPPSTSDQSSRMSLISTPGMGTPIGPGRRSGSPRTSTRASNQTRTTSSPRRPTPSPPPPSTSQP